MHDLEKNSSVKKLALFVSILTQPLLIPTYLFLLVSWKAPELLSSAGKGLIPQLFVFIFISTFIFPAVCIYILIGLKYVKNHMISDRKERTLPYMVTAIIYMFTAILLYYRLRLDTAFVTMIVSVAGIILLLAMINRYWKISAHGAGTGGAVGFIFAIANIYHLPILYVLSGSIILSGIVIWARLYLNEHRPDQVYTGWLAGCATTWLASYLKYVYL